MHPVLGDRPLDEIRIGDVVPILERLKADGKYATADYVRRVLKQLFSHAVLDETLVVSPTAELRGQRTSKRGRLDETGSATTGLQIWTPDEVKVFLAALDGNPAREMLIVALFTGLRRGEIVARRREDPGADMKRLSVRRAHDPYEPDGFGPPKSSGSIRDVFLGGAAQQAVRDAIAQAERRARTTPHYRKEGWLFPNAVGGMYDPRELRGPVHQRDSRRQHRRERQTAHWPQRPSSDDPPPRAAPHVCLVPRPIWQTARPHPEVAGACDPRPRAAGLHARDGDRH